MRALDATYPVWYTTLREACGGMWARSFAVLVRLGYAARVDSRTEFANGWSESLVGYILTRQGRERLHEGAQWTRGE